MLTIEQKKAYRVIEAETRKMQRISRDERGGLLTASELRSYIRSHPDAHLLTEDLLELVFDIIKHEIGVRMEFTDTQAREKTYRDWWQDVYDRDQQDLY